MLLRHVFFFFFFRYVLMEREEKKKKKKGGKGGGVTEWIDSWMNECLFARGERFRKDETEMKCREREKRKEGEKGEKGDEK